MRENEGQGEALDLAMALVDQSDLYSRLRMKPLYPELTEAGGEEINVEKKEETAAGGFVNGVANNDSNEGKLWGSLTQHQMRSMPGCPLWVNFGVRSHFKGPKKHIT